MTFFAATYTYVNDPERIAEHRPEHRVFLNKLHQEGLLQASGPLPETTPAQALLIMTCTNVDAVRTALADDPFQKHGIVTALTVEPWVPAVGVFADQITTP